jgi:hypothetical protein
MSNEETPEEEPTKGYYRKPHQLRLDCARLKMEQRAGDAFVFADYLCDMTMGWQARWIPLSYEEIKYGKLHPSGTRMPDTLSGLTDNKSIGRAIAQLLEKGIIEVVQHRRYGTLYAIHRRYWLLIPLKYRYPKWAVLWLAYYHPERDPLDDEETEAGSIMQPEDEGNSEEYLPADSIMQPGGYPNATEPVSLRNRADSVKQSVISDEGRQGAGPGQKKDTSQNTSSSQNKIHQNTLAATPPVFIDVKREEDGEDVAHPPPSEEEQRAAAEAKAAREREAAKHRLIDKENKQIQARLANLPRDIIAFKATRDSTTPAHTGWTLVNEKIEVLEAMQATLQAAWECEPLSEARKGHLQDLDRHIARLQALNDRLRYPWKYEQKAEG